MSELFVIRNDANLYLGKHGDWHNGSDPHAVFRSPHKDIALNELIEQNSRDISMRASVLAVGTDDKGLPKLEVLAEQPVSADATAEAGLETAEATEQQEQEVLSESAVEDQV